MPALAAYLASAGSGLDVLAEHRQHPRTRPGYAQVALAGPEVVGCVLVWHTRLRLGSVNLDCADLALYPSDVSVDLATALIEACLEPVMQAEVSLVRLHGLAHAYAGLGFAAYCAQATLAVAGLPTQIGTWYPASMADVPDLMALYEASYAALALSDDRTVSDWGARLLDDCWVLVDGAGRSVGYVRLADRVIVEAAADSANARRLLEGLSLLPDRPRVLQIPPHHALMRAGLQLGAQIVIQALPIAQVGPLIGIVDVALLVGQLLPELQERLAASRYAGWSGMVWLELGAEQIGMHIQGGTIALRYDRSIDAVRVRQLTLAGLAQLALGYRNAADLRATGDLACDDAALGLIDVLFGG